MLIHYKAGAWCSVCGTKMRNKGVGTSQMMLVCDRCDAIKRYDLVPRKDSKKGK